MHFQRSNPLWDSEKAKIRRFEMGNLAPMQKDCADTTICVQAVSIGFGVVRPRLFFIQERGLFT